jgi:amidohydrolase
MVHHQTIGSDRRTNEVAQATSLREDIDEIMPGVIADRRDLHEHPELAYNEFRTAGIVADRLRALGVEDVRTGIAQTGVTGLIRGRKGGDGPTVLLRADMDALPIHEENQVDYCSQTPGVMHACGHDAHTAILLTVAEILADRSGDWPGNVVLVFQPAEELGGGAQAMVDGGLFDPARGGFAIDTVLGLHVTTLLPVGVVGMRPGLAWAGADVFRVRITGAGGHGAFVGAQGNPLLAAAELASQLTTIVNGLEFDGSPNACSAGTLSAGRASNVVPTSAFLEGSLRTFTPQQRDTALQRLDTLLADIAAKFGVQSTLETSVGAPPLVNDPAATALSSAAVEAELGNGSVLALPPLPTSDDMALFLQHAPGAYLTVGAALPDIHQGVVRQHHTPLFALDDAALPVAARALTASALAALAR